MDSASPESVEAKELSLVGKVHCSHSSREGFQADKSVKVELRIALADSDARLETLLGTYLTPLLLKLASDSGSVRDKVRTTAAQHI